MGNASTHWVGLDVHKSHHAVAVVGPDGSLQMQMRVETDEASIRSLIRQLKALKSQGEVECAYEAGPTGYILQRQFEAAGLSCMVVAPSLIARKPGERIKTDRRDARKLAIQLRAGLLTAVCPPTAQQEAVRDLCRCRADGREDLTRARHRLAKMLLRRGYVYRGGSHWTRKHRQWMRGLVWENTADRTAFESYLSAVEQLEERLRDLETAIEAEAAKDPYRVPVAWLRCFRGFDTLAAMSVVAELYDAARFSKPRQLMAYLGLVPSESSSGDRRRLGSITKTGNCHLRRTLVNAAWQYRRPIRISCVLRKRRVGQPAEIVRLADRAVHRLRRRFFHLTLTRAKCTQKAVVSIARELVGFLWAALVLYPRTQQSQTA